MNTQLINLGAILLVGDGLRTAFEPRKEALLWQAGPKPYRDLMGQAAARPALARLAGLLVFHGNTLIPPPFEQVMPPPKVERGRCQCGTLFSH